MATKLLLSNFAVAWLRGEGGKIRPANIYGSWLAHDKHQKQAGLTHKWQSTVASPATQLDNTVPWDEAKPYKDIPYEPFWDLVTMVYKRPEMKKTHVICEYLFDKYGDIVKVNGYIPWVFCRRVEDLKTILASDGKTPHEPGFDFFVSYRGKYRKDLYPNVTGLLGSQGENWYKFRSAVQQDMMRPKSAMYYLDDISHTCNELVNLFDKDNSSKSGPFVVDDVTPLLYRWALESTGIIFLDQQIGCLEANLDPNGDQLKLIESVNVALGDTMYTLLNKMPLYKLFPTPSYRKFDKAATDIYHISKKMIDQAIAKYGAAAKAENAAPRNPDEMSVLEKMIARCGPDSDIPLVMAMDALMAGIDTTGNSGAFLLYHLADNPTAQEKLYQEIITVLGDSDNNFHVTEAKLNEMKYLKAVQRESQRIFPAVGGFARQLQKDVTLAGYQVPAGTMVAGPVLYNMRSDRYFDRPLSFEPERWLNTRTKAKQQGGCPAHNSDASSSYRKVVPFAFLPFSHGPRMCIGRRFAELELLLLAIHVVRNYRLEYAGSKPLDIETPFVIRPEGPVKIKFTRRM